MANQNIEVRHVQKTDIVENWQTNNPILLKGEIGHDSTTNLLKIGDGLTDWNALREINYNILSFEILSTSWVSSLEYEGYEYHADIDVVGMTDNGIADLRFDIESLFYAIEYEIFPNGRPLTDKIRLYSPSIPNFDLHGKVIILRRF